jgi:hypothetical protein
MATQRARAAWLVGGTAFLALSVAANVDFGEDCDGSTSFGGASCVAVAMVHGRTYTDLPIAKPVPQERLGERIEAETPPCRSFHTDECGRRTVEGNRPETITLQRIRGIPGRWAYLDPRWARNDTLFVPADAELEADLSGAPRALRRLVLAGRPDGSRLPG